MTARRGSGIPTRPILDMLREMTPAMAQVRFGELVDSTLGPDACWPWQGNIDRIGYGRLGKVRAHRLSWFFATGEDPGQAYVCHSCDNPPCVNPAHLFLGSARDNHRDSMAKGRAVLKQRLTDEDLREARSLWAAGCTQNEIATRLGAHRGHIASLLAGKYGDKAVALAPWQREGKRMPHQKLSDDQVREMRRLSAQGRTQRQLAAQFGVAASTVGHILAGRSRKLAY